MSGEQLNLSSVACVWFLVENREMDFLPLVFMVEALVKALWHIGNKPIQAFLFLQVLNYFLCIISKDLDTVRSLLTLTTPANGQSN